MKRVVNRVHVKLASLESNLRTKGVELTQERLGHYQEEVLKYKSWGFDIAYHENAVYSLKNILQRRQNE